MLSLAIRLLLPSGSRRQKKLKQFIARVRLRRLRRYRQAQYNAARQSYYKYLVTKKIDDESKKVSIVVPCYNTPPKYFEPLLSSIFAQGYNNWELVIVDASNDPKISDYIRKKSEHDIRISYLKTKNEGIALNTNKGIEIAKGNYIAFLDHDDTLDPNALVESIEAFNNNPSTSLVYSDEDKITDNGEKYFDPHFKPDFSLDMLRNVNYITHFVVVKADLVHKLKGIRSGFDGAQDYDFLLRAVDEKIVVGHIPKILYHWREAEGSTAADFSNKKHITNAGCRALGDHYKRRGINGVHVQAIDNRPGFYRAHYDLSSSKKCIYINLEKANLLPIEKEFIIDRYKSNKDVIKHNIKVVEGLPVEKNHNNLIINGAFIPANIKTDIASLFALVAEKNVAGVSPKIVRRGRIFDMGVVRVNGKEQTLFKGINPDMPLCFGSLEWVRNVNELTGNVAVFSSDKNHVGSRLVIWAHSEFVALTSSLKQELNERTNEGNYYNPNITELTELTEELNDNICDLIEVKR